ncbi:hypothetical protein UA08_00864 [Talaromyces atroroseus]|uniref:25S rRNA (Uridine(2843)-N(3))-methyltransferase n=1 Tax=Talaromyces atroroseus TaxID=1441469 RepID=A0A225AWE9_TALAT|nr:hypothetical protein UA08_00864 [Talaromyces atroroseus]OKL63943.1 hypothetical protein UA08_00864 [Talaromyces atroroseus]
MAPPNRSGKTKTKKQAQQSRKPVNNKREPKRNTRREENRKEETIDLLSNTTTIISSDLQQLLLNVFKYALSIFPSASNEVKDGNEPARGEETDPDLNMQIQTLKTHLYNRDFDSAFTDASPALLRAYALRWSASRCLAYAGLFRDVVECVLSDSISGSENCAVSDEDEELGVLCIGGGAGAEIVALAGAWRAIGDEHLVKETEPVEEEEQTGIGSLSLKGDGEQKQKKKKLAITAVDIAEWSDVIDRLDRAIHSVDIPGPKTCASPLIQDGAAIDISFEHVDILTLSESDLKSLLSHSLHSPSAAAAAATKERRRRSLISLMFTLNELFSTSIPKTTQLLLRLTDLSSPGTVLLVVDSPGSYSTLSFSNPDSKPQSSNTSGRQHPMKFLLDHTLLTVAEGKWEKLVSQDSRWFRRDVNSRLHYNVDLEGGQGFIKLEDMRFQIHVYRRLDSSDSQKEIR